MTFYWNNMNEAQVYLGDPEIRRKKKGAGHPTPSGESDDKTKSTPQRGYWKVHRLAKQCPAEKSDFR